MTKDPRSLFTSGSSSVCMLQPGKKVHYQNRVCKDLCGVYVGGDCPQICAHACGVDPSRSVAGEGIRFFPNSRIGNGQFDALFVNQGSHRLVVLHPLAQKHERLLLQFRTKGLSRREMEVVDLGLKGRTNSQIRKSLGVSRATLKTHLNNIYRKFPEARTEDWRGKG